MIAVKTKWLEQGRDTNLLFDTSLGPGDSQNGFPRRPPISKKSHTIPLETKRLKSVHPVPKKDGNPLAETRLNRSSYS